MSHDIILVLAGGGICAAVLKFIEFLLTRVFQVNDRKTEYVTKADIKDITKELKDTMVEMNAYSKNIGLAVNGIIHDRIIKNVDEYIDRNGITIEEISTLKSMYYPYKNLGGNGDVETAFEQACKLPVITKEEAIDRDIERKRKKLYGKEEK